MPKITPFLWFENGLAEPLAYYTAIFPGSKITSSTPGPDGSMLTATFELAGQEFIALSGGPEFHFNEAVSFFVSVETQEEVDYYWDALTTAGGEESQCGWLKDRFGLSWQVVPTVLIELLSSPTAKRLPVPRRPCSR